MARWGYGEKFSWERISYGGSGATADPLTGLDEHSGDGLVQGGWRMVSTPSQSV